MPVSVGSRCQNGTGRARWYRPRIPSQGPPDRRRTAELLIGTVSGALLLVAVFLPWAGSGAGSSIAARRVGDLLLSGTVEAWAPRWLGFCVYLVPVAGALVLIGTGLGGRLGCLVAGAGLGPALLVTGATIAALPRRGLVDFGTGAAVALVGVVLGAVAVGLSVIRLTRRRS
ncbi:MAG: hypothetical protein WKF43_08460 [Acidimicrobiales bacterium]